MTDRRAETNPLGARAKLTTRAGSLDYLDLGRLADLGLADLDKLPVTVKVLVEMILRQVGGATTEEDVVALSVWGREAVVGREFSFAPARVILQDFTGVPVVVDLAAMRAAIARNGGDPAAVDPRVPVDLVIDHSVQVDAFGSDDALERNVALEYERNTERYALLRWARDEFDQFRVVPPGRGIVHQVNLEHLARCVMTIEDARGTLAIPDTVVGTDSHTPMVNGLGVLGWGVGGIEAEAAMLGQPIPVTTPTVVGLKLSGELPVGVVATDLVLTVTELLRHHDVVGKFVEFYGDGIAALTVPDRATLSNMTPEYGATACLWPTDDKTLEYLRLTGRPGDLIDLVEAYTKAQGLFHTSDTPTPYYVEHVELDLGSVEPSMAGPHRPQERVGLDEVAESYFMAFAERLEQHDQSLPEIEEGQDPDVENGSVVIAAITSCTNTSNPAVMVAAGILARNAVGRGLESKSWVKTSLAPGSLVVTDYLDRAGLTPYLDELGFHTVGYGCTTCIGNSGPLDPPIEKAVAERDLTVAAVLSGNRNFEGRIHPQVHASYLASPPLVVAYAIAGTIDIDLTHEPLGVDRDGADVMLADIWPRESEIATALEAVDSKHFEEQYASAFDGGPRWDALPVPEGMLFEWDAESTYVREPSFFDELGMQKTEPADIRGARVLALLGDHVTTDHISPAGAIASTSPAGRYLSKRGVERSHFNSYGSRRGNHEVMIRGTFANIRLKNRLVSRHGGYTRHVPSGDEMSIFDAAQRYASENVPLVVLAGSAYGSGSSRDWAAKGVKLLGVKAVIATSYERIHRSNLVGMGVLPLQFADGDDPESLGLDGTESYDIGGLDSGLSTDKILDVVATGEHGAITEFRVVCRIESAIEVDYYRSGGVLQYVLQDMIDRV